VGEPGSGTEGFSSNDGRTSIFDYWSMPEFTKWVNKGAFDGGKLSETQKNLRAFYSKLVNLLNEPAFRNGDFFPLNLHNLQNPNYGRLPGETSSGHWLYSFLRIDPESKQTFLVVVNLNPHIPLTNVQILFPEDFVQKLPQNSSLTARIHPASDIDFPYPDLPPKLKNQLSSSGITLPVIDPLTPIFLQLQ
jgi:hypothetical protein